MHIHTLLTLSLAGGHYGPDDRKHSGVSAGIGLGSSKFLPLFLFIPDRSQTSHFRIFLGDITQYKSLFHYGEPPFRPVAA